MATQGIVQSASTNGPTPFSTHTSFLSSEALPTTTITVGTSPSTVEDKVNTNASGSSQPTALVLVAKVLANLSQETLARACLAVNPERFITPVEPTPSVLTKPSKPQVKIEPESIIGVPPPTLAPYMNGIESLINAANNNTEATVASQSSPTASLPDGECEDAESQSLSQSHSSFASHYSTSSAGSGGEAISPPSSQVRTCGM